MRKFMALLLALVLMLSLAACGGSEAPAATQAPAANAPAATPAAPAETPAAPTNLVIPSASCVANLNPLLETMKEGVIMLNPMYDPLWVKHVDEIRYYLAESYTVSEDGLEVVVKLRDGMKWHDGEAITADDMIFTLNVCSDTNNGAGGTNIVIIGDQKVTYEKVDELTVKITTPSASASYAELLGTLILIPEHVYGGNANIVGAEGNMKGIGSGAYKLREFVQDQYLVVEKFDDYYLGAPSIDTVTFKIISDVAAQEVALRNGEVNLIELANSMAVAKYSSDANYSVVQYPEGRVNFLAFNKFNANMQNPKIREAIIAALNQEEIIAGAYGEGMAVPANGVLSNANTFYDASVAGYKQDVEKAKSLVAELGLDKTPMTLYFNSERVYMAETAMIIQQQLKNVGITLNVIPVESAGFFEIVFADGGDYEMYLNGYGAQGDPDDVVFGMYNGVWGCNLGISDELAAKWNKARTVFSDAERSALYKEIQEMTVAEMTCYPIAYPNYVFVTTSNIKGTDTIAKYPIFEDYTKLTME